MYIEDLKKLAISFQEKSIDEIKKIYRQIEESEEKDRILEVLRTVDFNPRHVNILLSGNGKLEEKIAFINKIDSIVFDKYLDNQKLIEKVAYDKEIRMADKCELLDIFKNCEFDKDDISINLYLDGFLDSKDNGFSTDVTKLNRFKEYKERIKLYKDINPNYLGDSLFMRCFYNKNVSSNDIKYFFDKATKKYKNINEEQVSKISAFIENERIKNLTCDRNRDIWKRVFNIYLDHDFNDDIITILSSYNVARKSTYYTLGLIKVYDNYGCNSKFAELVHNTDKCLYRISLDSYCELLEEIAKSNFSDEAIKTFSNRVKSTDFEAQYFNTSEWIDTMIDTIRTLYVGEFDEQIDKINSVGALMGYLQILEGDNKDIDLTPKSLVRKYEEKNNN